MFNQLKITFHYSRFDYNIELLLNGTIISSNRESTCIIHINWCLEILRNCFEIVP